MNKIKKFLHNFLFWGFPDKFIDGDSFQQNYSCQFCDLDVTKDSQGNWFHLIAKTNGKSLKEHFKTLWQIK